MIRGAVVDDQTRCIHWSGPLDVVAMRFACCDEYWPCFDCHASADHEPAVWPLDRFDEPAVLCGVCRSELTVNEYLAVDACPRCGASFNPGCALHHHLYFEQEQHA
jgi:uncharacterized CHY-type Zn-finger protein